MVRLAAVKGLPVHHPSAGYIYFFWHHLAHPDFFENRIPLKPALGVGVWGWGAGRRGGGGGWGGESVCSLTNYSVHMKNLSQTGSSIFVILCVLCFQRQTFFTFILLYCSWCCAVLRP